MKNASVSVCKVILACFLCALVFWLSGCGPYSQLGETEAEGRRRHERIARINRQELLQDMDKVFLADKPSRLTDRRIP